ncbi:hypothetical protein M0R45_030806 [Rubus argutus]|uniref:Uncharacterized protein n=1 Tax=Rubus argutus TaxID=59490 RepID=A0AAW1WE61_RUBAR
MKRTQFIGLIIRVLILSSLLSFVSVLRHTPTIFSLFQSQQPSHSAAPSFDAAAAILLYAADPKSGEDQQTPPRNRSCPRCSHTNPLPQITASPIVPHLQLSSSRASLFHLD